MYCADQIHRMLIPSCLNKWLRDTFRLGERGRDDMAPRDTMTCLPYSMRHVLANISIAQEPGGGSHRIHRRLRRGVAYAAVYLSIRTCCILRFALGSTRENLYHSSADRYRALGVGRMHSIQIRGYFAPQHQSPRREGAPLVCMVTVCGPIRLRAGFVLGVGPTRSR